MKSYTGKLIRRIKLTQEQSEKLKVLCDKMLNTSGADIDYLVENSGKHLMIGKKEQELEYIISE